MKKIQFDAKISPKNANSGPHHIRLPAVKVTQVNPTVDNTKLLFFAKALRSIIGELGLKWAPSARPRSGSIMKNTISKSANKPINGVTRKPHLQSEAFAATSEPEKEEKKSLNVCLKPNLPKKPTFKNELYVKSDPMNLL